jgi:hypothetical protein
MVREGTEEKQGGYHVKFEVLESGTYDVERTKEGVEVIKNVVLKVLE